MATLEDLVAQIPDENLRARIQAEVTHLKSHTQFGLVFENHAPEVTPLFDVPIRKNSIVARRSKNFSEMFRVENLDGNVAACINSDGEKFSFNLDEIVCVARHNDSIFPCLLPVDKIKNSPDSLWHILIEAENLHALKLLDYVCTDKKVDCIYIDPPYNTGARDWKYNNDFVDSNDNFRHSKWLAMMQRRLILAKKILNPADSVLIVTIDEKEFLNLGCLLRQTFPEAHIQMVSIVINPNGVARDHEMYRVEEYAFFVYFGSAGPAMLEDTFFTSETAQIREERKVTERRTGLRQKTLAKLFLSRIH